MNTTVSTSAASAGASGAFVVLLQWVLAQMHITLPADVAAAAGVLLTWAIHTVTVHGWPWPKSSTPTTEQPKA